MKIKEKEMGNKLNEEYNAARSFNANVYFFSRYACLCLFFAFSFLLFVCVYWRIAWGFLKPIKQINCNLCHIVNFELRL